MSPRHGRGADMQESVVRVARAHGVSSADLELLATAHALAMDTRAAVFDDEDHPLYLHPGRTALILLRDAGVRRGGILAVASLTESHTPAARPTPERVRGVLPEADFRDWTEVPTRGLDGLAEALVTAPEPVRLVALAEHLDHLRHLHMLPRGDDWRSLFEEVEAVWGPVAERTHPELARRYALWIRTFRRRLGAADGVGSDLA